MPVNRYFDPGALIGTEGERQLLEDLVVESIQIHGLSVRYLPRTTPNLDWLYLEDQTTLFDRAVEIEMYLRSWDGFQGDGNFMSHMGVEIRDQATFQVAIRRFREELGPTTPHDLSRPREGDLIWYPLNRKLFEIRFVDKFVMHYPLGALQMWELRTELFEFSHQSVNTGLSHIDGPIGEMANTENDPLNDAKNIQDESDILLNFDDGPDIWSGGRY